MLTFNDNKSSTCFSQVTQRKPSPVAGLAWVWRRTSSPRVTMIVVVVLLLLLLLIIILMILVNNRMPMDRGHSERPHPPEVRLDKSIKFRLQ